MKPVNLALKCVKSHITVSGSIHEQFILNYLNINQGLTIGGLLRRTLLGDIGGTAITAVKIANINHEFATIKGIREDILEILLNLKGIILKNSDKIFKLGYLKIKGPAIVTANAIKLPSGIEIINPHHYIATILEDITLDIQFLFEYGVGYKLANQKMLTVEHVCFSRNSRNLFEVDAIFTPIQKVDIKIENFYDPTHLNSPLYNSKEKLVLDIWTNGSISPKEAIKKSLDLTINVCQQLLKNGIVNMISNSLIDDNENINAIYNNISVEELELSIRTYNSLKNANINTVYDILKNSLLQLKDIKNLDEKSVNEILNTLNNKFGITLK